MAAECLNHLVITVEETIVVSLGAQRASRQESSHYLPQYKPGSEVSVGALDGFITTAAINPENWMKILLNPIKSALDVDDSSSQALEAMLRGDGRALSRSLVDGTGNNSSDLRDRYQPLNFTVERALPYIVKVKGSFRSDLDYGIVDNSNVRVCSGHIGGPYGAIGVDLAFEKMLCKIFGEDFIQNFKMKRPAAWVDLMIAFEARKRTAAPQRSNYLNISLPFSFIDFYKRHTRQNVETALRKSSVNSVKWSSQGMLRMSSEAMNDLFQPTIQQIVQHIGDLINKPEVKGIKYLFLVGGFAESPMLQNAVQSAFSEVCRVIIPQDVGLTILKGAVLFGLDPTIVRVRRSPLTYGVGVLNKFVEDKHPKEKLLVKEEKNWCTDIFDKFVSVDQSVALGDIVQRSYCPARLGQRKIIINIYCSSSDDVVYITDPGVRKCGTINLDLPDINETNGKIPRREIKASMQFGDTEIKVTAMDVKTSKIVRAAIDFLSN
ncbi:heat shock 70 kDa protein 12B [Rhinoderma darwinii]|uniref:heat shock 70 kDa protein 12B n=1 Tax=Rhinoderma darwinii TaxID=43563 RepID=UPI003F67002A